MRRVWDSGLLLLLLAVVLSGCGSYRVNPSCSLPEQHYLNLGSGSPIAVQVIDDRPDKELLGVTNDMYKQRILLQRPIQPVLEEALKKSASDAGFMLRDDAPTICRVRVSKVELVWMAQFDSKITAEVAFDVSVVRDNKESGYKRISDTGWAPNETWGGDLGKQGEKCLSVVFGRAVSKVMVDPVVVAMLHPMRTYCVRPYKSGFVALSSVNSEPMKDSAPSRHDRGKQYVEFAEKHLQDLGLSESDEGNADLVIEIADQLVIKPLGSTSIAGGGEEIKWRVMQSKPVSKDTEFVSTDQLAKIIDKMISR
jgi:hypothetical protein